MTDITIAEIAPDPKIIPARCRICSMRVPSFLLHDQWICATEPSGGRSLRRRLAPSLRPAQILKGSIIIPSCMSLISTRKPTPLGRQGSPDGSRMGSSLRRRTGGVASSPGATNSCPADKYMANTLHGNFPRENL